MGDFSDIRVPHGVCFEMFVAFQQNFFIPSTWQETANIYTLSTGLIQVITASERFRISDWFQRNLR